MSGNNTRWHCNECNGTNVQFVVWIEANTNKVLDDYGSPSETDTNWCEDCEDHTGLVPREVAHDIHCDLDEDCAGETKCIQGGE